MYHVMLNGMYPDHNDSSNNKTGFLTNLIILKKPSAILESTKLLITLILRNRITKVLITKYKNLEMLILAITVINQ